MTDTAAPPADPAECPHCGTRLPAAARFCPACGRAVGTTTAETAAHSAPDATARARSGNPRREALITLLVLGVAALVVAAVAVSGRLPFLGGSSVPGAGEIWFGETYDAQTFEISSRWTSTVAGRPMAAVAHLTTPVSAGQATLHIALGGTSIASQPLNGLTGSGDLIGMTFTPPEPGSYTFTITGTDGTTLATGTISAS